MTPIEKIIKSSFMKRVFPLLSVCFVCLLNGCFPDENDCKQWEKPEINVGINVYGTVVIRSNQTGGDVTSQHYSELTIYSNVNKEHCTGSVSGPFTTEYKVLSSGELDKQSLGTYSFSMYNEKDIIEIKISASPPEVPLRLSTGKLLLYNYEDLEVYDGGPRNIQIKVDITFDTQNKKVIDGSVTVL